MLIAEKIVKNLEAAIGDYSITAILWDCLEFF
jgi:hypothetical protein